MSDATEFPHDVEGHLRGDKTGIYRRDLLQRLQGLRENLLERQRSLMTAQSLAEVKAALVAVEHSMRVTGVVVVGPTH